MGSRGQVQSDAGEDHLIRICISSRVHLSFRLAGDHPVAVRILLNFAGVTLNPLKVRAGHCDILHGSLSHVQLTVELHVQVDDSIVGIQQVPVAASQLSPRIIVHNTIDGIKTNSLVRIAGVLQFHRAQVQDGLVADGGVRGRHQVLNGRCISGIMPRIGIDLVGNLGHVQDVGLDHGDVLIRLHRFGGVAVAIVYRHAIFDRSTRLNVCRCDCVSDGDGHRFIRFQAFDGDHIVINSYMRVLGVRNQSTCQILRDGHIRGLRRAALVFHGDGPLDFVTRQGHRDVLLSRVSRDSGISHLRDGLCHRNIGGAGLVGGERDGAVRVCVQHVHGSSRQVDGRTAGILRRVVLRVPAVQACGDSFQGDLGVVSVACIVPDSPIDPAIFNRGATLNREIIVIASQRRDGNVLPTVCRCSSSSRHAVRHCIHGIQVDFHRAAHGHIVQIESIFLIGNAGITVAVNQVGLNALDDGIGTHMGHSQVHMGGVLGVLAIRVDIGIQISVPSAAACGSVRYIPGGGADIAAESILVLHLLAIQVDLNGDLVVSKVAAGAGVAGHVDSDRNRASGHCPTTSHILQGNGFGFILVRNYRMRLIPCGIHIVLLNICVIVLIHNGDVHIVGAFRTGAGPIDIADGIGPGQQTIGLRSMSVLSVNAVHRYGALTQQAGVGGIVGVVSEVVAIRRGGFGDDFQLKHISSDLIQ